MLAGKGLVSLIESDTAVVEALKQKIDGWEAAK